MKRKDKLEEEVEFWLSYINNWEAGHSTPVPERVQLLLDNALLKLEGYCPDNKQALILQGNNHIIH